MSAPGDDVTALLLAWGEGDREALDRLIPLVYDELRALAHRELRREHADHTLGTTALVNEAYLRLVDRSRAHLESHRHFLNLAARVMRNVLVDEARKRLAGKRGGGAVKVSLDDAPEPAAQPDRLLAFDEVLTRLEAFDPRMSRLVELRFFGGLTLEQAAETLGISTTTAWRDWNLAKAWVHDTLSS